MQTELVHHLGDSGDIVVAAANEADERFPAVLSEDAHAGEFGGLFGEVGVGGRPLSVEGGEVRGEVEVVVDEGRGVVGIVLFCAGDGGSVGGGRGGEGGGRVRCCL